MMQGIKGVIFDLDGTLIDSCQDMSTAINRMRADFNLAPLPHATIITFIGNGVRNLVRCALNGADIDLDQALDRYQWHYARCLTDTTRCYPGVMELLSALRDAGLRCAIVTNKPEGDTRTILQALELVQFFDIVIGGDSTPYLKPDPHAFLCVASRWGLTPDSIVVVGDYDTDIDGARNAGMHSIFVRGGIGTVGNAQPDLSIATIDALASVLLPARDRAMTKT